MYIAEQITSQHKNIYKMKITSIMYVLYITVALIRFEVYFNFNDLQSLTIQ